MYFTSTWPFMDATEKPSSSEGSSDRQRDEKKNISEPVVVFSTPMINGPVSPRKRGDTHDTAPLESDDDLAPVPHLHAKTYLAILAVCLIYVAQLATLVGVGSQGNTIASHFKDTSKTVWLSAPLTIAKVVLGPIVSQAADYWGRKWLLVSFSFISALGSLLVAQSTSINMAIGGCCVLGCGFGAQPLLHVVSSEVLPRRWRSWGQAADIASNSVGGLLGMYVGAALNRTNDPASKGFRHFNYMTMALFLASGLLCMVVYNPPPQPLQKELVLRQKLGRLDWGGYFLITVGLTLFSVGLSSFESPYEWSDPHVSAVWAVGMVFLCGLGLYETKFKKDGMFHHGLFSGNRNFTIACVCVFVDGIAFFGANTYFAFQIIVMYTNGDTVLAATAYSTLFYAAAVFAVLTGWYCARTKTVRLATVASNVISTVFFVCMATANRHSGKAVWGYPPIIGVGMGMSLLTLVTAAQLSTPPELISIASGIFISLRSVGATIGVVVFNALFSAAMKQLGANVARAVGGGLAPAQIGKLAAALLTQDKDALASIPGITPTIIQVGREALLDTYAVAFSRVWTAGACALALATIVAMLLFDPSKEFNMRIDAPLEKEEELYDYRKNGD